MATDALEVKRRLWLSCQNTNHFAAVIDIHYLIETCDKLKRVTIMGL